MNSSRMKIFGMTYGLVGDLIMGLPYLNYFEKKYPGSYKIWAIQKKLDFCAPLYLNHSLIDRVHITEDWQGFGPRDMKIMDGCDIAVPEMRKLSGAKDWWNRMSCIESKILMAGMDLEDMREIMSPDDWIPRLEKWFDVGFENYQSTYSKERNGSQDHDDVISIFPGVCGSSNGRTPSSEWWRNLIKELARRGYRIFHFGHPTESDLSSEVSYSRYVSLPFMSQIKLCLSSRMVVGTDSGSMWVVGAYEHPAIHVLSNWLPNHNRNFLALAPVNSNATNLFEKGGCDRIRIEKVVEKIEERIIS